MHQSSRPLILGFFGMAAALTAATAALAAAQLPVEQILSRNAAARGGLEAWRKVTTISLAGQMDANKPMSSRPDYHPPAQAPKGHIAAGATPPPTAVDPDKVIELPYRLEMKRPLKTRLEIDVSGKTAVQVYDGVQGAKLRPFLGRDTVEPYTRVELDLAATEQELDGPLIDHERKGTKVVLDGVEPVNGSEAYKLKLTYKNGTVHHLWVDATSFLDVKMDATRHIDGKNRPVETYLKNYKSVNGLMFPMTTETVIPGVPGSSKIVVASVTVNPSLDDSRFKLETTPPKPGAKPGAAKPGAKP